MDSASRRDFLRQLAAGAGLAAATGTLRAAHAAAWTQPAKTYTNPVYGGSMPDPGVLLHRGVYYAFGTTGRERKADGRIFTLLRSPDLVAWEERGGALTPPDPDPALDYWAPEPAFHDGTFYLYYAMGHADQEQMALRVATSSAP